MMMPQMPPIGPYTNGTPANPMAALMDQPVTADQPVELEAPEPRPVVSELDRWAQRHYKKYADELDDGEVGELSEYVRTIAREEVTHWEPNKSRMREDQQVFALTTPKGATGHDHLTDKEKEASGVIMVTLNDPFVFVMKIIDILSGTPITIRMPSMGLGDMIRSQQLESRLYWWWNTWKKRSMQTSRGAPGRAIHKLATLRGWITILTMPDSSDESFPWDFRVMDPLELYPCYGEKDQLTRVIRQFTLTASQARRESFLADAEDMYESYKATDTVKVIGWYDEIYHFSVLEGKNIGATEAKESRVVKKPVAHGVKRFDGTPKVPWVVIMPIGDFSQGMSQGMDADSTKMVGLGILYGIHDVYNELCRLISMLLTSVALGVDPPVIHEVTDAGLIKSEGLDWKPGAENYVIMNREKYTVMKSGPDPQTLQPAIQMLQDRETKGMLPSVFYGDAYSGTSGFAVNLLKGAAQDKLLPWTEGFIAAMEQVLESAMSIYYHNIANTLGEVNVTLPVEGQARPIVGQKFDRSLIEALGTDVQVKFGEVTPQDEASIAGYVNLLAASGIVSKWWARDKLGIQDPNAEELRIFRETAMMNPQIAMMLGPAALQMSDDQFMQSIIQGIMQAQQQAAQQAEAANQAGAPGQMPTSTLPNQMQPQTAGAPVTEQNPQDQLLANLLASRGGSAPVR